MALNAALHLPEVESGRMTAATRSMPGVSIVIWSEGSGMSNEMEDRDGALAEASRRGNPQAFVKLATRWWAPVYRIAWNMSGSPSFAAEVTEQALLAGLRPSEWWPSSGASTKQNGKVGPCRSRPPLSTWPARS